MSAFRGTRGLFSLASLLGLAACSSLLGIDDVHEGPAPGSEAGAGSAGVDTAGNAGQASSSGGRAGNGGTSANGGMATQAGAGGGQAGEGEGGKAGAAGAAGAGGAAAGSAGSGGAGSGSTVHGTVIDFWGHKLPSVPISIGGKLTTTDAQGAFSVDNVAAQYDASLLIEYMAGKPRKLGWVFQGLSRRDPTLQVYEGLPDKLGYFDIKPNNPATLTGTRTLSVALGGPDGSGSYDDLMGAGTDGSSMSWEGPDETQATAYALMWEPDADTSFPSKYIAYDSTLVALTSKTTSHGKASFDLAADTIPNATISGTVTGSGFTGRMNYLYLRFPTNAVMRLVKQFSPPTAGFSFTVPNLAGATSTFAAADGDLYTDYGIVHKDGLAPNSLAVTAAIPTPARSLAVTPNINAVSATTQFSFKPGSSGSVPFVVCFQLDDADVDERLYVVSAKAPFVLPARAMYALQAGKTYYFHIQTHGAPATVDAMAVPTGFLDSFSTGYFADTPDGPRQGDGSFTQSKTLAIKTAP